MGDEAEDLRDKEEEAELQIALHKQGRCDPWYCPFCSNVDCWDWDEEE